jgi:hypothetical protein
VLGALPRAQRCELLKQLPVLCGEHCHRSLERVDAIVAARAPGRGARALDRLASALLIVACACVGAVEVSAEPV